MTSKCARFDQEGLLQFERGERLDDHFRQCADCVTAAAAYTSLQRNLAAAPVEKAPGNWEASVWAEIKRREEKQRSRRLWPFLAPFAVAAAGLAIAFLPIGSPPPGLELNIVKGGGEMLRGKSAQPGDILELEAARGDYEHAEVRVYRDGVLALRCGTVAAAAKGCTVEKGRMKVDMVLGPVGRYEPFLLLWNGADAPPVNEGRASEQDLDAAVRQGAKLIPAAQVDVY